MSRGTSEIDMAFDGDEAAFVPYLACGDPSYDASMAYCQALIDGGADVLELGLAFSEPIAEGSSIQGAVVRALQGGMTPTRYFEFVEELNAPIPVVCMTYYNLIYQFGRQDGVEDAGPHAFARRSAEAGVDGFVVPDLPVEEAAELRAACDEHGLDLVSIVAPTTGEDRLGRLIELSSGYLYVQARLGVTGARAEVSDQTGASLSRLDAYDIPKAVGFGISSGEQAARVVSAGADGVIVGSALVDIVAEGVSEDRPVEQTATQLRSLAQELKQGAKQGAGQASPSEPRPERT
jgi:tryptophan synthase alpha chain